MFHPASLQPGIGNTKASGCAESGEGLGWLQTLHAKQAGHQHAGAPDAREAVSPHRAAGAEIGVQLVDDPAKLGHGIGNGMVHNRKRVIVDSCKSCCIRFLIESEKVGFVGLKERDKGAKSLSAQRMKSGL